MQPKQTELHWCSLSNSSVCLMSCFCCCHVQVWFPGNWKKLCGCGDKELLLNIIILIIRSFCVCNVKSLIGRKVSLLNIRDKATSWHNYCPSLLDTKVAAYQSTRSVISQRQQRLHLIVFKNSILHFLPLITESPDYNIWSIWLWCWWKAPLSCVEGIFAG